MMRHEDVKIIGGFEGSNIHNILQVGPGHFSCEMKPEVPSAFSYPDHHGYWFYLKVENARAREIAIDITNCDWMPSHWKHYKPVVTYSDPGHLNGHQWERIEDAGRSGNTFSFTHRYSGEAAWVALRYPYTYSYHQAYFKEISENPLVEIETLLVTREGRGLDVAVVTDPDRPVSQKKKVLIYAREHGVEQEGSWVCQGVIDFLLSISSEARTLMQKTMFIVIPISAPDAASHGRCTDPLTGRMMGCDFAQKDLAEMRMGEARAIWKKVKDLASDGGPVDICISLHSPHGWEENIWTNLHDSIKRKEGKKLNKAIFAHCSELTRKGPEYRWGKFSLPGRCAREFESIALLLEINQHAKKSFLSITSLHRIGEAICKGIHDYYKQLRAYNESQ